MSILQEYEEYRQKLGEEEWNKIDQFLEEHGQYDLSDVLYKERVWKVYEDWKNGKFTRKSNIKSSGNDIVDNLMYLTQNMWFEPIDMFADVIYNGDEIMNVADLSDCVEFGTNNGQELLIYDTTSDGRKHIKYSGSLTTVFDELIVTHLFSKSGKVYEADYDAIWDELAAVNNWNGEPDFDEVESSVTIARRGSNMKINRKKNNIKSNRKINRRPIKAAESYGWVVDDWRAQEAYDFAIDSGWWNEADLNADIVRAISQEELAACLAFIFRNNDFQAWNEYSEGSDDEDEDIEESRKLRGKRSIKSSKRRNTRRPVKAARITTDFRNFKPWSGAVDTWNELEKWDKIDLLEQILDDTYYNEEAGEAVLSETELNDILWFEPETVYEWVGLYYNDETGEVSDEPFDEEDEEDEDFE